MSDKTNMWADELTDAVRTLRTMKDELKVQIHLGSMEARKRFEELETRLETEGHAARKTFKVMAESFAELRKGLATAQASSPIEYVTRESILKMLSDAEVARVGNAEAGPRLSEGEEYLDLEQLGQGVLRTDGVVVPMGQVLPRKSVEAATWTRIVSSLPDPKRGPQHAGSKR